MKQFTFQVIGTAEVWVTVEAEDSDAAERLIYDGEGEGWGEVQFNVEEIYLDKQEVLADE